MDLDAYFARIGMRAPAVASLDTLATVLEHHMTRIPFENLDVLLGRPPKLDLASLFPKLVDARRGGYCYEHATLFGHVLEALGFTVHRHSARVTGTRAKSESPRTHMFLSIDLPEGTFVVDPGFGSTMARVPLHVDGTPNGDHWLAREGTELALMQRTTEKVAPMWVSTMEREFPIDFELANHFTSTHPLSSFTRVLMMRAFTADGRVTVRNRSVIEFPSGRTRELASGAELRGVCREHFGFDLPALDALVLPS